jgi:hypothetical protein
MRQPCHKAKIYGHVIFSLERFYLPMPYSVVNANILLRKLKGALSARLARSEASDRVILSLEIASTKTGRAARILEVQHRLTDSYPVYVDVLTDKLPEYLQESVYVSGNSGWGITTFEKTEGKWVKNANVASTPDEFEAKLRNALGRGAVKATMLSLLATTTPPQTPGIEAEPNIADLDSAAEE